MKYLRLFCLLIIVFAASCNGGGQRKTAGAPARPLPIVDNSDDPVELPVNMLPTINGSADDTFTKRVQYPGSISTAPDSFARLIAAYGAAYRVWIGPKNWHGNGATGVNGSIIVRLYPQGDSAGNDGQITYKEVPACKSCILEAAAPYFPEALKKYNAEYKGYQKNKITIPEGLNVSQLSPTLLTYTLPEHNGLQAIGVAYYVPLDPSTDPYFAEAKFVLPVTQRPLADFLVKKFIEMRKLR